MRVRRRHRDPARAIARSRALGACRTPNISETRAGLVRRRFSRAGRTVAPPPARTLACGGDARPPSSRLAPYRYILRPRPRARGGESRGWMPAAGRREGVATSTSSVHSSTSRERQRQLTRPQSCPTALALATWNMNPPPPPIPPRPRDSRSTRAGNPPRAGHL